ncbi:MAG: MgtC/SapB family protein [Patescibacteria group bacterium]
MIEEYFYRILAAALVGGLIGLEREYHHKSAGFRTMMLISMGAALFTIMGEIIGGPDAESSRISSSIVTGIGFLGAGVILRNGLQINGLTTAATIWLTAAMGIGMGVGEFQLTSLVAVVALAILWLLPRLERAIDNLYEFTEYSVVIRNGDKTESSVIDIFELRAVRIVHVAREKLVSGERVLKVKSMANPKEHARLDQDLANSKKVISFTH